MEIYHFHGFSIKNKIASWKSLKIKSWKFSELVLYIGYVTHNYVGGALSYKRNEINKSKFFLQIWWTSDPIRHLYLWKLFPPKINSSYRLLVHFRSISGPFPVHFRFISGAILPKLANWKNWFCIWPCICTIHSWFNLDILAIFVDRPPNYSPLCTLQIINHIDISILGIIL